MKGTSEAKEIIKKKRDVLGYESIILQIMMPMHAATCFVLQVCEVPTFMDAFHIRFPYAFRKSQIFGSKNYQTIKKKVTFVTYTTTKKSLNSF